MKITILVNTLTHIEPRIYSNHIAFFGYTLKHHPDWNIEFFTPPRMSIDTARNNAAKIALETESDYLMFLDDDVMIPVNALELLIEAKKDICAGLVIIRGMPFNVMAFKYEDDMHLTYYNDLPLAEPCKDGHINFDIKCDNCHLTPLQLLTEVGAVGFSCCLIDVNVLKAVEPPYFITGVNHTEDIYFCIKTRELEPNPSIFLHTGIQPNHLLGPEGIEWARRRKMQEFYAPVMKNTDHGIEYINNCLAKIR